jgi:hypothetical protein
MFAAIRFMAPVLILLAACGPTWAQADDPADAEQPAATDEKAPPADEAATTEPAVDADRTDTIDEVAENVDQSPQAREVSAGILKPIYTLAERFSFPAFHWIAFAVMAAGVVSFALQMVLGKLVVLSRMSISFSEILSDALGLVVSVIGLVLTTQAAAENSTFTTSAFSVLSASAVGVLAGFIFYLWGQKQELQAVEGRRVAAARREKSPPSPPRG